MKRYALKGINDDESMCMICGKVELKRVMWLIELDAEGNEMGEAFHCGTTCGAKLMQRKQSEVKKAIDSFAYQMYLKQDAAWHKSEWGKQAAAINDSTRGMKFAERKASGVHGKIAECRKAFELWWNSQPQYVEI